MRARVFAAAALCLFAVAAQAQDERVVVWKKKDYAFDALPRKCPESAREAVGAWAPFAETQGYDIGVTSDGRVVILHQLKPTQAARQLRMVKRVADLFDDELQRPKPKAVPVAAADEGNSGTLPEDPEAPPVDFASEDDPTSVPWVTSWGGGVRPNGTGTIVLIEAADAAHYAAVLDHVVELTPHLESWRPTVAEAGSFALDDKLTAAWTLEAPERESWNPDNELVHRLSELLVTHRFGWQPYWVTQGWAWHAEWELTREVWCFPHRTEPVPSAEHGAWKKEIRRLVQARTQPLGIADLTALRPAEWNGDAARYAWGTFRMLTEEYPGQLSEVLAVFNRTWDRENRIDMGGGNWRRNPEYELSADTQLLILREFIARDILNQLPDAFRKF